MNITSLFYFQELAKNLHFTKTADNLYISQQTLSNHIKRLENYYGTLLFNRKPNLSLTYAGESLLVFAQHVIQKEQNLMAIISDIESDEKGLIRFGASTARGMTCLPEIIPKFNRRYPKVEIRFIDSLTSELEKLVEEGDIDFALVLSGKANKQLIEIPLLKDQIYLCVPESLLNEYYQDKAAQLKEKSISGAYVEDFVKLPFSMFSNRLGKSIYYCFEDAGYEPNVCFSTPFSKMLIPLCAKGTSACFITQMSLSNDVEQFDGKVNIFPLYHNDKPMILELSLIMHKDKYLTNYSNYFLDILYNYFDELDQVQLARLCE